MVPAGCKQASTPGLLFYILYLHCAGFTFYVVYTSSSFPPLPLHPPYPSLTITHRAPACSCLMPTPSLLFVWSKESERRDVWRNIGAKLVLSIWDFAYMLLVLEWQAIFINIRCMQRTRRNSSRGHGLLPPKIWHVALSEREKTGLNPTGSMCDSRYA